MSDGGHYCRDGHCSEKGDGVEQVRAELVGDSVQLIVVVEIFFEGELQASNGGVFLFAFVVKFFFECDFFC